jgi:hypothetical protein
MCPADDATPQKTQAELHRLRRLRKEAKAIRRKNCAVPSGSKIGVHVNMTRKDFERIGKRLLPLLPDEYTAFGELVLATPVRSLLRAIHFDRSSNSKDAFFVKVFFQPLYVPSAHLVLSFGKRLNDRWNCADANGISQLSEAVKMHAVPYLESIRSPADFPSGLQRLGISASTLVPAEAVAFSYARAGKWEKARAHLSALPSALNGGRDWEREILGRGRHLLSAVDESPAAAEALLNDWEEFSVKSLGLERFR